MLLTGACIITGVNRVAGLTHIKYAALFMHITTHVRVFITLTPGLQFTQFCPLIMR